VVRSHYTLRNSWGENVCVTIASTQKDSQSTQQLNDEQGTTRDEQAHEHVPERRN
jgi:hypothetical protein